MRILVLGGTRFIGRHTVESLAAAGHEVSVLNRGCSPDPLSGAIERLRGDRDAGAAGLGIPPGRTWDACIDFSGYTPRQVRASVERLHPIVGQYVYISAVSAYGDPVERPVFESQPRVAAAGDDVTDVNAETYGPCKAAAEAIVQERFGDRCALLRPQSVVGPHDPDERLTYWIGRAQRGGPMLAPGDGADVLQVIDVRDVARFVRTVVEDRLDGAFNLAGARLTWTDFVALLDAPGVVWVAADLLEAAGVTFQELPIYRRRDGPRASLMDVSNDKACHAGLCLTDMARTIADTRAWMQDRPWHPQLDPVLEAALIEQARRRWSGGGSSQTLARSVE
jgi:2'-hydroxyisoflavone reductase